MIHFAPEPALSNYIRSKRLFAACGVVASQTALAFQPFEASVAMVAQANSLPQNVLSLLR